MTIALFTNFPKFSKFSKLTKFPNFPNFPTTNRLHLQLPQAVNIAVFVDGLDFAFADTYYRLRLILKVDADTAIIGLNIDKGDMVLRQHRVRNATHLNLYSMLIKARYNRQMLLGSRLLGIRL